VADRTIENDPPLQPSKKKVKGRSSRLSVFSSPKIGCVDAFPRQILKISYVLVVPRYEDRAFLCSATDG
jgi:hypothetical protein